MHSLTLQGTRERVRTLVVYHDVIWIWPGIALTLKRGSDIVPLPSDEIQFWITRLHGPDALSKDLCATIARAAFCLSVGNETKAQHQLDTLHLTALSTDGVALMHAVASELNVDILSMPSSNAPRTWTVRDIKWQRLLYKEYIANVRLLQKGGPWNEERHRRWPKGSPNSQGGRFAPSAGEGGSSVSIAPPGIGHNGGPPLEDPPKIPEIEPPPKLRYGIIKAIGRWIASATVAMAGPRIRAVMLALAGIAWVIKYRYDKELQANRDPPKTLEELRHKPGLGYDEHHIVEKKAAADDKFPDNKIEAPENKVFIPAMKHREITAWYRSGNRYYGGKSPRQYLRGKSWRERYEFGKKVLIKFGVLRP